MEEKIKYIKQCKNCGKDFEKAKETTGFQWRRIKYCESCRFSVYAYGMGFKKKADKKKSLPESY